MLLVLALLTATGAPSGVTSAFGAHELSSVSHSQVSSDRQSAQGAFSQILNSSAGDGSARSSSHSATASSLPSLSAPFDPTLLPALGGAALLHQLSLAPASTIATFVSEHHTSVVELLRNQPAAAQVSADWSMLSMPAQRALISSAPELVGNLEGVPFSTRDVANRGFLRNSITRVKRQLSAGIGSGGVGRAELVSARHHLMVLEEVSRTLAKASGNQKRQLVTFDAAGETRAAVVVGDLATADYVSYLVPGMFFTVQGQIFDWTEIAENLQSEQTEWIKTLSKTDTSLHGKTAATVSWIGYATPGALDIASLAKADTGANYLGRAITGVSAARKGNQPFVSLIAHSYGSTAAMIELAKGDVSVDALAIVGSPGSATQTTAGLSVKNNNVFVGEAALDPVVSTAFYGSDPGSPSFGARTMDVSGGTDAITSKPLGAAVGHLGYFDPHSQAMRNFALISLNESSLVSGGSLADAARTPTARRAAGKAARGSHVRAKFTPDRQTALRFD